VAITIRDLAKKSGYSIATISRALSDGHTVKPETRRQIVNLADEMGYPHARHTRQDTGHSRLVMLIVGDLLNPFYLGIIKGSMTYFMNMESSWRFSTATMTPHGRKTTCG
jgi:LacI family repressor for deo operon, udp, cdd, tsx, nupC, and nupG